MPRVLVVDDENHPRSAIAMVLRIKGFEVVSAESAWAGLQVFEGARFDLAVIDIFLQEVMSGIELIRLLRERAPGLPIIAISGLTAPDSCVEYFESSGVIRLSKPFRPTELMLAIDTATRSILR